MFFLILCHIVEKWLKYSFSFSPPTDKVDAYAIKKKKNGFVASQIGSMLKLYLLPKIDLNSLRSVALDEINICKCFLS